MNSEERIKLFGMSHALVERDLDKVEKELHLDLQRSQSDDKDEDYYPQFDMTSRAEAAQMAKHYELFYCLERSIRLLIADTLKSQNGEKWWDTSVPQIVKDNVKTNIQKETDAGMTPRSDAEIDYTTFGELGEIVRSNWGNFDAIFSSEKAFTKIMTSLNMLRGPIAHCCPLAEDEIVRLRLAVADWFRLMG
ncbi:MAG: Swt1 family HEPN domain-containing protein [Opitutaceae bacterium]|nr:Swt1 family HEPN domain-containing protein [Opitutaceae bacterium]